MRPVHIRMQMAGAVQSCVKKISSRNELGSDLNLVQTQPSESTESCHMMASPPVQWTAGRRFPTLQLHVTKGQGYS